MLILKSQEFLMENINDLIDVLLRDEKKAKEIYEEIQNDPDYLENNFEGKLNSDGLLKIIDRSYKNKYIKIILGDVLYFCDHNSVTDPIFRKLVRYPGRMRKTYFIALSHCNLSFYQLMYLNRKKVATEAFCQLIYLIYTNDCFTDKDLSHFMSKNTYPAVLLASVFQYLLSLDIKADMTKKRLLEEWQKSHPNVLSK